MHTVVLSSWAMNRPGQAIANGLLALSLLLGGVAGMANVHAQHSEKTTINSAQELVIGDDPGKPDTDQRLLKVQQRMVSQALEFARELDFESATRILEDASLIQDTGESRELIENAHEQIIGIRDQRVVELRLKAELAMEAGDFSRAERVMIEMIALGGAGSTVMQLRLKMNEDRVYGGVGPGKVIKDKFLDQDHWTPESVVIVAGSFMMGSPVTERGRKDNEGPQHRVVFNRGFALGQREVSVSEFRVFVKQTRYRTDAERAGFSSIYNHRSGRLTKRDGVNWQFAYDRRDAGDVDPVVHVSWNDALAYVGWLAAGTGEPYRLPSEAEFEYALRAGKNTRYWWGRGSPGRLVENLTGESDKSPSHRNWSTSFKGYTDQFWGPAPVGSFNPSPYHLFDMGGNVGEWVMDCWHDTYMRAPVDGSAWVNPGCSLRVIRGGYWASSPDQARSAFRISAKPDSRDARIGFRIARDL